MEEKAKVKCDECGEEFFNLGVHKASKHQKDSEKSDSLAEKVDTVLNMLSNLIPRITDLTNRVERIETGGKNEFKKQPNQLDVQKAANSRERIDPRTTTIVDEILGEDFGINITPNKDNPGFLFTILVPQRLSEVKTSTRPVLDPETKLQKKNERNEPVFEEYWPEDKRSRAIASWQNYDAIKEHCERVRAHIVATYQKSKQPLPEFKLKAYLR